VLERKKWTLTYCSGSVYKLLRKMD